MQDPDLNLLITAAKKAGELAKNYDFRKLKVSEKEGGAGPVTEADIEIDRMLFKYLTSARPDYGWLCEESTSDIPHYEKNCAFVIDPIDGTKEYIAGRDEYIAKLLIENADVRQSFDSDKAFLEHITKEMEKNVKN